jgi:ribonuclease P protein subunit POP4
MMQKGKKPAKPVLVGEAVQIVWAKNPSLTGISGRVIDETRNTIIIETNHGAKTLIKDQIKLMIGQTVIEGTRLVGRAEERIKK